MRTQREYEEDVRADAIKEALGWTILIAWLLLSGLGKEVL